MRPRKKLVDLINAQRIAGELICEGAENIRNEAHIDEEFDITMLIDELKVFEKLAEKINKMKSVKRIVKTMLVYSSLLGGVSLYSKKEIEELFMESV